MPRLKNMEPRTKTLIALILVIILFSFISILLVPQTPKSYPAYVIDSPSPTGLKGLYSLLDEQLNGQLRLWNQSPQELSLKKSNQLMIMIEPFNTLDTDETNILIDWMKAGNNILLVTEKPDAYFNQTVAWVPENNNEQLSTITGFYTLNGTYTGFVNTSVRLIPEANDKILLIDDYGVLATSKNYGEGKLFTLITPDWFTNKSILEHNHLDIILPFIEFSQSKVVLFNDYIHGYENKPTILEIYPDWFIFLFLQTLLILLLWLWYKGKRFGPIETPREWVVRYGDERIRAIAAWYERGGFYKESLLIQEEFLLDTIKTKWGISTKNDSIEHMKVAEYKLPTDAREKWINSWKSFQEIKLTKKVSHKEYLKWSKELEEMRKEVEKK